MHKAQKLLFVSMALVALLFSTYCAKIQYGSTLRDWTRSSNIYNPITFNAKIMWKATYLSDDLRSWARSRIVHWMKLPEGSFVQYPSYLEDNDAGNFLVSVYTPKGYPPINVESDNFWDFTLELPGGQVYAPSSIETVTVTEREKRLFPYINQWSTFYRVKFPVSYLNPPFDLALRSAGVTSLLKWK